VILDLVWCGYACLLLYTSIRQCQGIKQHIRAYFMQDTNHQQTLIPTGLVSRFWSQIPGNFSLDPLNC